MSQLELIILDEVRCLPASTLDRLHLRLRKCASEEVDACVQRLLRDGMFQENAGPLTAQSTFRLSERGAVRLQREHEQDRL